MIAVAGLAVLTMFGALLAQFVAWIGPLLNTVQLPDKTWFVLLLVMGLLSFGFIAMLIYIIAGPKDPEPTRQPAAPTAVAAPIRLGRTSAVRDLPGGYMRGSTPRPATTPAGPGVREGVPRT